MIGKLANALNWLHPPDFILSRFSDGETGVSTSRNVMRHLSRCRRCQIAIEAYRRLQDDAASDGLAGAESQFAKMLAEERERLRQSIGDESPVIRRPEPACAKDVRLVFGSRSLTAHGEPVSGATAEQMCVALLGGKVSGSLRADS